MFYENSLIAFEATPGDLSFRGKQIVRNRFGVLADILYDFRFTPSGSEVNLPLNIQNGSEKLSVDSFIPIRSGYIDVLGTGDIVTFYSIVKVVSAPIITASGRKKWSLEVNDASISSIIPGVIQIHPVRVIRFETEQEVEVPRFLPGRLLSALTAFRGKPANAPIKNIVTINAGNFESLIVIQFPVSTEPYVGPEIQS